MSTATLLLFLLTFVCGLLCARLISERGFRRQLLAWLQAPESNELPDGHGEWRNIFSAQQRLRKVTIQNLAALDGQFQRFQIASRVLPDGVILLDSGGRIEWINDAAGKQLGIDPLGDKGTLITQLVRQPSFFDFLDDFLHAGERFPDGIRLSFGDMPRTLELHLYSVPDQGALLHLRDISDAIRTERMRADFVANVSHELRTPITVISGFLEQLTDENPPIGADAQRFLKLMADQSQRMSRLIEDLLTLSRLENDYSIKREEDVDASLLIADLLDEARALSNGRHELVCKEVAQMHLRGNREELRSAFSNLLSNAVRYTPQGGTVEVAWTLAANGAVFSVTDSGIGISAEHIPRLTERFYRVDHGRSASTGGTGLGLAIVKHVLSRHEAKLSIRSASGRGSTFSAVFSPGRLVCGAAAPSHGD